MINEMKWKPVKFFIFFFQVDGLLLHEAPPVFDSTHLEQRADISYTVHALPNCSDCKAW